MANKKRSTRRAFGRRALAFGIAMFAMVTLTAVGFASWLISTNSTAQGTGGIVTQSVSQANIKITVDNVNAANELINKADNDAKYEIVFAAPSNAAGLITFNPENGTDKPEKLTFSFNGRVENAHRVGELLFSVKVPDAIVTAAGLSKVNDNWVYTAANAFIELPAYAMDKDGNTLPKVVNGTWDGTSMTEKVSFSNITDLTGEGLTSDITNGNSANGTITLSEETSNVVTFTGTELAFGWGARYNRTNPATSANEGNWGNFGAVTGLNSGYTTNLIQLELLQLQAIVNGVVLSNYYPQAMKTAMDTQTNVVTYVQGATNQGEVQTWLTATQTALSAAIYEDENFKRPTYTLYIEANVRQ